MIVQKSFKEEKKAALYLVATPIGNLEEMTPRAINILKKVDIIAAEDTRNTQKLITNFDIKTPLISYHMHNEKTSAQGIIKLLDEGKSVALVSDAGYPLISDPGQIVVPMVIEQNYSVIPISGSSAFINALVASGLVIQPFTFMGFLENKDNKIKEQLNSIKDSQFTTVFYVSVHRVEKTLEIIRDIMGDREICLAREITKLHEEFIRGKISEVLAEKITLKGEFVLVIEGKIEDEEVNLVSLLEVIDKEVSEGLSPSRAISKVAKEYNVSKNELYSIYQNNQR